MEIKIKALLKAVTTLHVLDKGYPDIFPCVTFHLYGESGALFGKGTATEEKISCQVDIWCKVKSTVIDAEIKKIKQAIVAEKYFAYPTKDYDYETVTKIHHTNINFELLESEE